MDGWTIGALLETATGYLREKGSTSPRLDAELLLAKTLGTERIQLYTEYDRPLVSAELDGYRGLVARRARSEPIAHILGRAHFRHLCLEVGPAVLIPRPETEELVDAALQLLRLRPAWSALTGPKPNVWTPDRAVGGDVAEETRETKASAPLIADVGTGSGAIALSLAQEAGARVIAIDSSREALAVASRNRAALRLEAAVDLRLGNLLEGIPDRSLYLVVSNPPYVREEDLDTLAPDVRLYEPLAALNGGSDGLEVIRRLLPQAARVLEPGGTVSLEVGDGQAGAVAGLAREAGFSQVSVQNDLSGKERIVSATLPGAAMMPLAELTARQFAALAAALADGAAIGLPTDTVYGIAARWDSEQGVRRLFEAKGRGAHQPLAVLFSSVASIARSLPDLHDLSLRVLAGLLPGPYTFVVATATARPSLVGTVDSLGVRVPALPALLDFLDSLGAPVAATSANPCGGEDARSVEEVDPSLLAFCSLALTAPEATPGSESARAASTVVDLRPLADGRDPIILREGAVGREDTLQRVNALLQPAGPSDPRDR